MDEVEFLNLKVVYKEKKMFNLSSFI